MHKIKKILFIIGFCICIYPFLSSLWNGWMQTNQLATYQSELEKSNQEQIKMELENAQRYNSLLFQSKGRIKDSQLSKASYQECLNPLGDGIMGSIEIPKINVQLPVGHGTADEVLLNGVGHLEMSSLPVGGASSHSVLTAHRGLPNAKLFTRLDELEKGDYFYLNVLGSTLAYQVMDIREILPEEVETLKIVPEKDVVSLITCTPYGINTHRLVVTGERIPYEEKTRQAITPALLSGRELFFICAPLLMGGIGLISSIKEKRKRSEKNVE